VIEKDFDSVFIFKEQFYEAKHFLLVDTPRAISIDLFEDSLKGLVSELVLISQHSYDISDEDLALLLVESTRVVIVVFVPNLVYNALDLVICI
jgi:hypothetical protein